MQRPCRWPDMRRRGADVAGDGKDVNRIDMNIYADKHISSLGLAAYELVKRDGSFRRRRGALTTPPGPR